MRPAVARIPGLMPRELVAHCLVIEGDRGLVVVDTGFGTADVTDGRMGRVFPRLVGARFDLQETLLAQVDRLGYDAADVRDIVLTHLDLDHAGGLSDFPQARVHVHEAELTAATQPTMREKARYVPAQWRHGPDWVTHGDSGEDWFGFGSVRVVGDDVLLVPLHGHTRGHSGVAVRRDDEGWLLHAGDAYFAAGDKESPRRCPPGTRAYQAGLAVDSEMRRANLARLQELHANQGPRVGANARRKPAESARTHDGPGEVTIFCAHDRSEFQALAESARTHDA